MRYFNFGGHLQTVLPSILPYEKLKLISENVELSDGDFQMIHYPVIPQAGKTILLVHGMGGNRFSPIVHMHAKQLLASGFTPVIAELRGSSDMPNRSEKFFNAGSVSDFDELVSFVANKIGAPLESIFSVSLGANLVVNWSAISDTVREKVKTIHCIGLPLSLEKTASMANVGFNRVYQKIVFTKYKSTLLERDCSVTRKVFPQLKKISTMLEFDEFITVPLNGYRDLAHYYDDYSARQNVRNIQVPCTVVMSSNDPLIPFCSEYKQLSNLENINLELIPKGGHLGKIDFDISSFKKKSQK